MSFLWHPWLCLAVMAVKKKIQINNCRRYIWLIPPHVSTFHQKSDLFSAVKKQNIIQIIVSVKSIDMNSPTIRHHIGLFSFPPLCSVSGTKYKPNTQATLIYYIWLNISNCNILIHKKCNILTIGAHTATARIPASDARFSNMIWPDH